MPAGYRFGLFVTRKTITVKADLRGNYFGSSDGWIGDEEAAPRQRRATVRTI